MRQTSDTASDSGTPSQLFKTTSLPSRKGVKRAVPSKQRQTKAQRAERRTHKAREKALEQRKQQEALEGVLQTAATEASRTSAEQETQELSPIELERKAVRDRYYAGVHLIDPGHMIVARSPYLFRDVNLYNVKKIMGKMQIDRQVKCQNHAVMALRAKDKFNGVDFKSWDQHDMGNFDLGLTPAEIRAVLTGADQEAIDLLFYITIGGNHWLTAYQTLSELKDGWSDGYPKPSADVYSLMDPSTTAMISAEHNAVSFTSLSLSLCRQTWNLANGKLILTHVSCAV
jgi:hypothetical protein